MVMHTWTPGTEGAGELKQVQDRLVYRRGSRPTKATHRQQNVGDHRGMEEDGPRFYNTIRAVCLLKLDFLGNPACRDSQHFLSLLSEYPDIHTQLPHPACHRTEPREV